MENNDNDKHIEFTGVVLECIRGTATVELESGQTVVTKLSGKMRMNKINVLPGDKVMIKVSPYDTSRGIIFRILKGR